MVKALHNQSLFDIAILYFGTVAAVFDIAFLNNISVTEVLVPGQNIQLPNKDYGTNQVAAYFDNNGILPATAISDFDLEQTTPLLGIGTMAIGTTFIVAP